MSFQQVFSAEINSIRESAVSYAKKYPNIAPLLENQSQDQDVERLIEAFAYLSAQLQVRMDDGVCELSQDIIRATWPDLLKPFPAHSIIAIDTDETNKTLVTINKNTSFFCRKNNQQIEFKSLFETNIYPIKLLKASSDLNNNLMKIKLDLQVTGQDFLENLKDSSLVTIPVYLSAGLSQAVNLRYLLLEKLKTIKVKNKDRELPIKGEIKYKSLFKRMNISEKQPDIFQLIPYYFNFPEVFNYIDFTLDLSHYKKGDHFPEYISIEFDCELAEIDFFNVKKNDIVLSSVPVCNIEKLNVAPINRDHENLNYPLRVDGESADNKSILEVTKIEFAKAKKGVKNVFKPWSQFDLSATISGRLYREIIRNHPIDAMPAFSVSFDYASTANIQKLSVDANGFTTNAHEILGIGDIKPFESDSNKNLSYRYRNISYVSAPVIPDYSQSNFWHLMHYLSLRFTGLCQVETLQKMVLNFNQIGINLPSRQKALTAKISRAFKSVQVEYGEKLYKRHIVRGQNVYVDLKEEQFLNIGDMYLFAMVLKEIFESFVEVNSFIQFHIGKDSTQVKFQWPQIYEN